MALMLFGCSKLAHLSQRLSTADRVVVENTNATAFSRTVTGVDVSNLITAIKSSKTKKWGTGMDWESPFVCDLEFYAGTNHLASIPTVYGVFNLDGVEYYDGSRVLETFCTNVAGYRTR
jgi:hypothetical protein